MFVSGRIPIAFIRIGTRPRLLYSQAKLVKTALQGLDLTTFAVGYIALHDRRLQILAKRSTQAGPPTCRESSQLA